MKKILKSCCPLYTCNSILNMLFECHCIYQEVERSNRDHTAYVLFVVQHTACLYTSLSQLISRPLLDHELLFLYQFVFNYIVLVLSSGSRHSCVSRDNGKYLCQDRSSDSCPVNISCVTNNRGVFVDFQEKPLEHKFLNTFIHNLDLYLTRITNTLRPHQWN